MLKRLVGVITVKDDWAVQSVGFQRYFPIGRPEIMAENFDQWQLDEILVIDISRSKNGCGPNFDLLDRISAKNIMTPLCYVGGVRKVDDAVKIIKSGADRIGIDSLFRNNLTEACAIGEVIGRQAVVRVQPVVAKTDGIYIYDHLSQTSKIKVNPTELINLSHSFGEYLVMDVINEGGDKSFSEAIIDFFTGINIQLICFGGITSSEQITRLYTKSNISAVAIGNSLSYKEIANKKLLKVSKDGITRTTSFGLNTMGPREW